MIKTRWKLARLELERNTVRLAFERPWSWRVCWYCCSTVCFFDSGHTICLHGWRCLNCFRFVRHTPRISNVSFQKNQHVPRARFLYQTSLIKSTSCLDADARGDGCSRGDTWMVSMEESDRIGSNHPIVLSIVIRATTVSYMFAKNMVNTLKTCTRWM
jgi:hypothetical protein